MTARNTDIALLFGRYGSGDLGFHSGRIITWDPVTGANSVEVNGVILSDLTILNPAGAVILGVGVNVSILRYRSTYFILGRTLVPGTSKFAGTTASFTAGALNQSIGAALDTGYVASGAAAVTTTHTGKWLIQITASLDMSGTRCAGRAGFSVTGAQTIPASDANAAMTTDVSGAGVITTVAYSGLFTGAPGQISVQPVFKLTSGPTSSSAAVWTNRSLIVTPM